MRQVDVREGGERTQTIKSAQKDTRLPYPVCYLELDTGSKSVKEVKVKMPATHSYDDQLACTCSNKTDSTISPKHLATPGNTKPPTHLRSHMERV